MKTRTNIAQAAIKNECQALTLPAVIQRLTTEKALVDAEISATPTDGLFNAKGWELINREQELHTTLTVLQRMTQTPMQIAEPCH